MTRITQAFLVLAIAIAAAMSICAASDDILGSWLNQDKDAKIEIFKCGNDFCGKITWLKEPAYPTGSKEGVPGTPKVDTKNSDASRRNMPLMVSHDQGDLRGFIGISLIGRTEKWTRAN